jgi:hypothetical protein
MPPTRWRCEQFFGKLDRHDIRMRFASPRAFSVHLFLPIVGTPAEGMAFTAVGGADTVLGIDSRPLPIAVMHYRSRNASSLRI